MAHGKTLEMKSIKRPARTFIHEHAYYPPGIFGRPTNDPFTDSEKDRTLPGKARIRARRLARAEVSA